MMSHHSVKMVPTMKIENVDDESKNPWKILQDFTKTFEDLLIPSQVMETTILKTHLPKPRTRSTYYKREVR